MTFVPPPGFEGDTTLSLASQSVGATPAAATVTITSGIFSVTNTNDSGPGSLRQAIVDSNAATGGTNTIEFAIPGARRAGHLATFPAAGDRQCGVDRRLSQPGYTGTPLIELSGSHTDFTAGLTITGSDVTIRGLAVGGFSGGAGVLISGAGATGNVIEANDLGTDPTGTLALPNAYGVQIVGGASNNLIDGTIATAGNLIAFNIGPGVVVEGENSTGDQITANRVFDNDTHAGLQFNGSSYVNLSDGLIAGLGVEETIEASFETTGDGIIIGSQSESPGGEDPYINSRPDALCRHRRQALRRLGDATVLNSGIAVNDGAWHEVALVVDGASETESLYLDGQLVASATGYFYNYGYTSNQIGTGYAGGYYNYYYGYYVDYDPATTTGWFGFQGKISNVQIWSTPRMAGEILEDIAAPVSVTSTGLTADYPFDEGHGTTALDQTPNQNEGTLAESTVICRPG